MSVATVRILSDLHFGDSISRVRSLSSLRPLLGGADRLVFNGDSLETRAAPGAGRPVARRREFLDFVRGEAPHAVLVTGNHDADISEVHSLDLLGGRMFVTHGEILFEGLAPWSPESPDLRVSYRRQLESLDSRERASLEARLVACKRASLQSHAPPESPPRGLWRHTARKFWPPGRILAMLRAWHELPERMTALVRRHRPEARFAIAGHTHYPGVWIRRDLVVVNTGSFCPPFGGYLVDVSPRRVEVRRIRRQGEEFHPGRIVARFALTPDLGGAPDLPSLSASLIHST